MSLTYTDIFCGAGGSSIGLTEAGMELKLAANHWARALETHAANFARAEHLLADVSNYDMRRLPRTEVLWASPICTELTPAGGQARRRRPPGQLDLLEEAGHVGREALVRTRATFHDVIRAAEVHRYAAVIVENVTEAASWELFGWWLSGMATLGYNYQLVSVSSAHVGGAGNPYAPQWRDRLYIVLTRTGIRLPDVAPRPLAWCAACGAQVQAIQSWKRPGRLAVGKYGRQYVYRCPRTECRHAIVEPYVLPSAAAIDWTDLGRRIGDRPRPLAPSTVHRIRAGLALFAQPALVRANAHDPDGSAYLRARPAFLSPFGTVTTTRDEGLATPPFLTLLRSGRVRTIGIDEPVATIVANGSNHGLVLPVGGNNHDAPAATTAEPMRTRVTRDTDALVTPAFVVRNYGGRCQPPHAVSPITQPFGTISTTGHHALVVPYRGKRSQARTTAEPLHTVATRDSAALVQPEPDIADCRFRMLKPREHLRAQRFPDDYVVTGNHGEQTMQAGNAVSANVAHWLGAAVAAVL